MPFVIDTCYQRFLIHYSNKFRHLLLYPSFWLLVPGLGSQFLALFLFLYNLLLMSVVVGNIFDNGLQ